MLQERGLVAHAKLVFRLACLGDCLPLLDALLASFSSFIRKIDLSIQFSQYTPSAIIARSLSGITFLYPPLDLMVRSSCRTNASSCWFNASS